MSKKFLVPLLLCVIAALSAGGCAAKSSTTAPAPTGGSETDAVSSASTVYYEKSSLNKEELFKAIANSEGACTIATVNEDGTPNLIVASPGTIGDNHLQFGLAPNQTTDNLKRTGKAMICYYIKDPKGADKFEVNRGARLSVSIETDAKVLEQLGNNQMVTYFRIDEILPIG